MDKGPEAFRTISEVADDLDLPQHVLRFWETRFAQIKPLKRGGGRRYYRPDDVTLLRGIKHLLYGEGYTIKGVQRILREQGPKHVMMLWQEATEDGEDDLAPMPAMPEMFAPHRAPSSEERHDDLPALRSESAPQPPRAPEPVVRAPEPVVEQPRSSAPAPVAEEQRAAPRLSQEDVKQLQLTLYELMECKDILDSAR